MIEHIPSKHSSNESTFNSFKEEYSDALRLSGYNRELKYIKMNRKAQEKEKKKKCTWFNPSFYMSVGQYYY